MRPQISNMRTFLQRGPITPGLVLCSAALSSRETLAAILPALEGDVQISVEDALYGADLKQLFTWLRALPETVSSGAADRPEPRPPRPGAKLATPDIEPRGLKENLPTAALVTLEIARAGWQQLVEGEHQLLSWVVPRDLSSHRPTRAAPATR
jgi:phosphohistidine phosphatase